MMGKIYLHHFVSLPLLLLLFVKIQRINSFSTNSFLTLSKRSSNLSLENRGGTQVVPSSSSVIDTQESIQQHIPPIPLNSKRIFSIVVISNKENKSEFKTENNVVSVARLLQHFDLQVVGVLVDEYELIATEICQQFEKFQSIKNLSIKEKNDSQSESSILDAKDTILDQTESGKASVIIGSVNMLQQQLKGVPKSPQWKKEPETFHVGNHSSIMLFYTDYDAKGTATAVQLVEPTTGTNSPQTVPNTPKYLQIQSWSRLSGPKTWLGINAGLTLYSLFMFWIALSAQDSTRAIERFAQQSYLPYDLVTTVVWCFEAIVNLPKSTSTPKDDDQSSLWFSYAEVGLAVVFVIMSFQTVWEWRFQDEDVEILLMEVVSNLVGYFIQCLSCIRILKSKDKDAGTTHLK